MGTPIPFRTPFHRSLNVPPTPPHQLEATPSTEPPSPNSSLDVINRLRAENAQLRFALQQAQTQNGESGAEASASEASSETSNSTDSDLEGDDVLEDSDRDKDDFEGGSKQESYEGDDYQEHDANTDNDDDASMSLSRSSSPAQQPDPASEIDLNRLCLRLSRSAREIYANRQLSTMSLDFARRCLPRREMLEGARPPWETRETCPRVSRTRRTNMVRKAAPKPEDPSVHAGHNDALRLGADNSSKEPPSMGSKFREARLRHERQVLEQENEEAERRRRARKEHMKIRSRLDDTGRPTVTCSAGPEVKRSVKKKRPRRSRQLGEIEDEARGAGIVSDADDASENLDDHADEDGGVSIAPPPAS